MILINVLEIIHLYLYDLNLPYDDSDFIFMITCELFNTQYDGEIDLEERKLFMSIYTVLEKHNARELLYPLFI